MTTPPRPTAGAPPEQAAPAETPRAVEGRTREERLKSALKANIARRKAQARARAGTEQDR